MRGERGPELSHLLRHRHRGVCPSRLFSAPRAFTACVCVRACCQVDVHRFPAFQRASLPLRSPPPTCPRTSFPGALPCRACWLSARAERVGLAGPLQGAYCAGLAPGIPSEGSGHRSFGLGGAAARACESWRPLSRGSLRGRAPTRRGAPCCPGQVCLEWFPRSGSKRPESSFEAAAETTCVFL